MVTNPIRALRGFLFLSACLACVPAAWAVTAGTMEFVFGDVRVRGAGGVERKAVKGTAIEVGETVVTGTGGNAQMRMVDNAFLAVRPDTELAISDYRYSGKPDGTENALLRLVKGTMRAFTGAIVLARKDRFSTVTPTATIGIRGSGNVAHYSPDLGTLNHTIEGSHVVSSVNEQGQVIGSLISTPGQTVQVLVNQAPVRIPTPPFLLQAATSPPAPGGAPAPGGQKTPGQTGQAPGAEGGTSTVATARATAEPDTALVTAATTLAAPVTMAITSTTTTALTTTLTGAVCDPGTSSCTSTINTTTGTVGTVAPPSGTTAPVTPAPVTPVPSVVFHNPSFASPPNGYASLSLTTKDASGGFESVVIEPQGGVVSQPATNYLLDTGNNLAQIQNSYPIEADGFNYIDTATDTTSSATGRYVKFSGGSAQDTFAASDGSIYLGRWQGGSLDLYSDTGATGGNSLLESISLGSRSAHWALGVVTPTNYVQKLTGFANYSVLASTHPTDALGNVGTLSSATLAADFSAQTVQAGVNLSFASTGVNINALTPFVPIAPSGGFSSETESQFPISINGCAGVSCPGFHGGIHGGFARPDASAALIGYQFVPNLGAVPANTANSDAIQGVVAFQSPAAPTIGTNPTPVGARGLYATQAFYPVSGGGNEFLAVNRTTPGTGPLPSSAFVMDGSNLVRVVGGAWNVVDRGNATQCLLGAPCLSSSAGADAVSVFSMGGGTVGSSGVSFNASGDLAAKAQLESFTDGTGLRLGRYQGGVVNASAPGSTAGDYASVLTALGSNSVMWAMREIPTSIPLTGTAHYLPVFATAPTDAFGAVGSLNYARLDANFSNQTVNPAVSASISNQTLTAWGRDVPINPGNFGFDVSSSPSLNSTLNPAPPVPLAVSCTGNCPPPPVGVSGGGYGARISGGFTGDGTASGALLRYTFNTRYDPSVAPGSLVTGAAPSGVIANNYVNGLVAFGNAQPFAPTASGTNVLASYYWFPQNTFLFFGSTDSRESPEFNAIESVASFTGPNGNLLSVARQAPALHVQSLSLSGDLSGASSVTTLSNGISFGRYSGVDQTQVGPLLSVDGVDDRGPFSGRAVVGSFNWIQGPGVWPVLLTEPITGSATYSVLGASSPTDQNNVTGTLNSATLNVSFDRQAVDTSLAISMPPHGIMQSGRLWIASASNLALGDNGSFSADTGFGADLSHRNLSVALNGDSTNNAQGHVSGTLSGPALNGAILSYTLGWGNYPSHEHVNGVVGFGPPTFSSAPTELSPYRIRLGANGSVGGFDAATGSSIVGTAGAAIDDEYLTKTTISAQDPTRLKFDSKGAVTEFDGRSVVVSACATGGPCGTNEIPTRVGIIPSGSAAAGALPAMPAIVSGAATVLEFGSDPFTGVSWGRYSDGNFAVVDRITGNAIGSGNASLGPINHYLLGPVQSGPTTLPTTGTATYTLVGATSPTEFANGVVTVGTLNSATLSANFTAKTIDTAVSLTTGPRNWTASATAVPIIAGTGFEAARSLSGTGPLSVGCSGTGCNPSSLAGRITGAFFGATGQGAGIAYSLNTNGSPTASPTGGGITVGGVAAFRR